MSSLTDPEKRYLEKILEMDTGYVLDYSNSTFDELFRQFGIDIHSARYEFNGTSKAKKLRAFWQLERDGLVSEVLSEMLDSYEVYCDIGEGTRSDALLAKSKKIVLRLKGEGEGADSPLKTESFLEKEFRISNINKLPVEASLIPIIESRLDEAMIALNANAHLSVIFLCGSVLEAVLLGAAKRAPSKFNISKSAPKDEEGTVKKFHEWSLAQLIDVATHVGVLKPDIKKFSHGLRDFRNYIHPYEQLKSNFQPDEHTAKLCLQVLRAAIAGVLEQRNS